MIRDVSVIVVSILFCVFSLSAQYSVESSIKYTVDEGLPSSTCYDVAQDSKGYIWVATEGGLAKFNGLSFETYSIKDGLPSNEIVKIIIDKDDRLWINSVDSLIYFHNEEIHSIDSDLKLNLNRNFNIYDPGDGKIWIAYFKTLKLVDIALESEIEITNITDKLIGEINLIGEHQDTLYILDDKKICKIANNQIQDSIMVDIEERKEWLTKSTMLKWPYLIYSNLNKIHKFNLLTEEEETIYIGKDIIKRIEGHSDAINTLTFNALVSLTVDENMNVLKQDTLIDKLVTSSFFLDKEENIWLAGYKNGLYLFPKQNDAVKIYDCEPFGTNHLESIVIHNDEIIAGTDDNSLMRIKDGVLSEQLLNLPSRSEINRTLDILPLENNKLLLSTDAGISVLDSNSHRHLVSTNSKRLFINDTNFVATTFNRSYTGKIEDLLNIEETMSVIGDVLGFSKNLTTDRAYSSIQDSHGDFWIGDVQNGLTKISGRDTTYYEDISKIFRTTITRIAEIENGVIAVATNGQGIIIISENNFLHIDSEHGLSSNICYNLNYRKGKLLVSTNRGLTIVSDINVEKNEYNVNIFNKDDGLPTNEILAADSNESMIALATNSGIATIDLNRFEKSNSNKKVNIENFEVNNQKVKAEDNLKLEPNQNNIRINYVVPEFRRSTKNIYSYKLEGLSDSWIKTTSTETNYSNLKPGKYTFKVKLDNVNASDQLLTDFTFEIKRKFQQTNLFKWLMAIGSLFLLFTFFSYVNNKRQKDILKKLVSKKTVELQSKMEDLSILNKKLSASNQELEQFAYIASHDLQEPINSISGFSKILESKAAKKDDVEMKQFTSMISGSAARMKDLIHDILSYSRIGTDKKFFKIDCNEIISEIESDLSKKIADTNTTIVYSKLPTITGLKIELRLLFQNLISNGIKFQKEGQKPFIEIKCKSDEEFYTFSVIDNGIGIKPEYQKQIFNIFQRLHSREEYAGTGIGLAHCKKIIDLHNGEIWVESDFDRGSIFYFTIDKNLNKNKV